MYYHIGREISLSAAHPSLPAVCVSKAGGRGRAVQHTQTNSSRGLLATEQWRRVPRGPKCGSTLLELMGTQPVVAFQVRAATLVICLAKVPRIRTERRAVCNHTSATSSPTLCSQPTRGVSDTSWLFCYESAFPFRLNLRTVCVESHFRAKE